MLAAKPSILIKIISRVLEWPGWDAIAAMDFFTVPTITFGVRVWDTRLKRIFDQANATRGHGHRFRDNFAVELLLQGVPMESVAVLLGHQSIRITEKHYAPWVRARQEQLEAYVSRVWSGDPLELLKGESQTKGTRKLREKSTNVNYIDR